MNQMLSPEQIQDVAIPLPRIMTRKEKLLRFASIVRNHPVNFVIFSNLEHRTAEEWDMLSHPQSAFAVAARDPVLVDAGLSSDTVGAAVRFFELSRDEMHAFSCNCGGAIGNDHMAQRIEGIAQR